jgi:hypothetical protein
MPVCVRASESVGDSVGLCADTGEPGSVRLGESEIENLNRPIGRHFDVGRLEIPMNNALFVRGFQSFRDLACDGNGLVERQGTLEVGAFHELHDQRALLDTIHGRDVGVIQRGQQLRFALEARHVLGVVGQRGGQDFDGDVAIELGIAGAVNLAHATGAKRGKYLVRAEFVAYRQRHSGTAQFIRYPCPARCSKFECLAGAQGQERLKKKHYRERKRSE